MAKDKDTDKGAEPAASSSIVMPLIILTVIAAGAGGGASWLFFESATAKDVTKASAVAEAETAPMAPLTRLPADHVEVPLAPILAKFGGANQRGVRIEGSLLMTPDSEQSKVLVSEVANDIIAYLSGMDASVIEGPKGFTHLHEDLEDRAIARGQGVISGLLITGFAVQ